MAKSVRYFRVLNGFLIVILVITPVASEVGSNENQTERVTVSSKRDVEKSMTIKNGSSVDLYRAYRKINTYSTVLEPTVPENRATVKVIVIGPSKNVDAEKSTSMRFESKEVIGIKAVLALGGPFGKSETVSGKDDPTKNEISVNVQLNVRENISTVPTEMFEHSAGLDKVVTVPTTESSRSGGKSAVTSIINTNRSSKYSEVSDAIVATTTVISPKHLEVASNAVATTTSESYEGLDVTDTTHTVTTDETSESSEITDETSEGSEVTDETSESSEITDVTVTMTTDETSETDTTAITTTVETSENSMVEDTTARSTTNGPSGNLKLTVTPTTAEISEVTGETTTITTNETSEGMGGRNETTTTTLTETSESAGERNASTTTTVQISESPGTVIKNSTTTKTTEDATNTLSTTGHEIFKSSKEAKMVTTTEITKSTGKTEVTELSTANIRSKSSREDNTTTMRSTTSKDKEISDWKSVTEEIVTDITPSDDNLDTSGEPFAQHEKGIFSLSPVTVVGIVLAIIMLFTAFAAGIFIYCHRRSSLHREDSMALISRSDGRLFYDATY